MRKIIFRLAYKIARACLENSRDLIIVDKIKIASEKSEKTKAEILLWDNEEQLRYWIEGDVSMFSGYYLFTTDTIYFPAN